MKILYFLLLIPVFAHSQKLEPIWKLQWKMDMRTAITTISANRNVKPLEIKGDTSLMGVVRYKNQFFNSHKAAFVSLFFLQNRFLRTEIFFDNPLKADSSLFLLYDSIKSALTAKYFEPQYCESADKYSGYTDKLNAVKSKSASYYCNWFFPLGENTEKGGRIYLQISEQGVIVLLYDYIKAAAIEDSDF